MPKIHLLSEELINKIAAGEVIERPASVIKELLENSLDAKATKISIEIEDSGKKRIKVSDNGFGMDEEDACNSVLRHATSKLNSAEDLFSIQTLGFRGEALASIAAVSLFSVTTKIKDKLEGFNLVLEGGQTISSGLLAAPVGTTIEVKDIFFNTPARKKFLKSDAIEVRHIIDVITRYALINPQVSFKLSHDRRVLLHAPAVDNIKNRIASIYGTHVAKEMMEINFSTPEVNIFGYLAKPYQARNDRTQQSLYINQRWIKNEDILKSVYDAFHSLLFVNKHPVLVLNLELNPQKIDVNVHPHKSEVKIEQKDIVCNVVFTAVRETLQKNNLVPIVDMYAEQQLAFGLPKAKYSFEKSAQTILASTPERKEEKIEEKISTENKISSYSAELAKPKVIPQAELYSKIPPLKILGQVHKTFFVAETIGGVVFIDQHAAHERVLYEKFMAQFLEGEIAVQNLLQGDIIEVSAMEKLVVMERRAELQKLGFTLEEFGGSAFVLKTIPSVFGRTQGKEMFFDLLSKVQQERSSVNELKEEIITRMACRAAVMAGEELTVSRIQSILEELGQTKLPYSCPHGRPTIIKTEVEELEKKFRRK